MTNQNQYQSRFIAYAKSGGYEPGAMVEVDRRTWPGAPMCGFILWMSARWTAWGSVHGLTKTGGGWLKNGRHYTLTQEDHKDFDTWLNLGGVSR